MRLRYSLTLPALLVAVALAPTRELSAQTLLDVQQIDTYDQVILQLAFGQLGVPLTAAYGIDRYAVTYTMDNLAGEQDTVSGLLVVPRSFVATQRFPVLVSQHGTTQTKFDVPSNAGPQGDLSTFFASQGYVTVAPDFLNMGVDQEGFHPYVHARTEALAAIRMMEALATDSLYASRTTGDLYLTGYSQGGHASMALHELLVEEFADDYTVTAAAHLSGPYSLSHIMLDEVALKDTMFQYPAFIPYTALAMNAVYDLFDDPAELFAAPYADNIRAFAEGYETGAVALGTLNQQLLDSLAANGTPGITFEIFTDAFEAELRTNPSSPFRQALRDNDTYDFVNPTPTRLFYCRADDQVRYRNSIVAADTMRLLGAADVEAVDVDSDADHGGCILPAVTAAIDFFAQAPSSARELADGAAGWNWVRAANTLRVEAEAGERYLVEVLDARGAVVLARDGYRSGELLDLGALAVGWYAVQVRAASGRGAAARGFVVR